MEYVAFNAGFPAPETSRYTTLVPPAELTTYARLEEATTLIDEAVIPAYKPVWAGAAGVARLKTRTPALPSATNSLVSETVTSLASVVAMVPASDGPRGSATSKTYTPEVPAAT